MAAESSARRSCASGAATSFDGQMAKEQTAGASRRGRVALARMVVSLNHTKPYVQAPKKQADFEGF